MERTIEPAKPTLKHLMVLKRMVEEKLGICAASYSHSRSEHFFNHDLSPGGSTDSYDWFRAHIGAQPNITGSFYRWGWINVLPKPPENKDGSGSAGIFAWYDCPYVLNKNGVAYWHETGLALYERLMQVEADKRAAVERLVAIRPRATYRRADDRMAGGLVRVVRETDKRLYVEPVLDADGYAYLEGNRGTQYISRDQVTIAGITEAKYKELRAVEDVVQAEKKALHDEESRAIQEIRDRFKERRLQKQAEHDGLIQGILE